MRIIYDKPELYWNCMVNTINHEEKNPASQFYVVGYNEKATALGLPPYNSVALLLVFTSALVVLLGRKGILAVAPASTRQALRS